MAVPNLPNTGVDSSGRSPIAVVGAATGDAAAHVRAFRWRPVLVLPGVTSGMTRSQGFRSSRSCRPAPAEFGLGLG